MNNFWNEIMYSLKFKLKIFFLSSAVFFFNSNFSAFAQTNMIVEANDSIEWNQNEGFYKATGKASAKQNQKHLLI